MLANCYPLGHKASSTCPSPFLFLFRSLLLPPILKGSPLRPLRADGHSTKPSGCYGYRGNAVTKETEAEALGCRLRLARVTPPSGGSRWVGWVRWRRAVGFAAAWPRVWVGQERAGQQERRAGSGGSWGCRPRKCLLSTCPGS